MKAVLFGRHRQFLFRTYLILVAGLLLTAIVLDMGFDFLQSRQLSDEDRWLVTSFDLIEREMNAVPASQRSATAEKLGGQLGLGIRLLQRDEIVSSVKSPHTAATLVDPSGNTFYLRDAASLNALIRLGPVEQPPERFLLKLLPPLFYLSIFMVVGVWLRPLLSDLNLITGAAQRFAADYREPLSTAAGTTQLTNLASNLDDMSSRLSGLIRSQKELIAALSHEMRTPLARIRFALAVMGNKDKDEIQEQLDELSDDVQEIDQLIATMLNYARLDHPDLQMNWQDVPLVEWLAQSTDKCSKPGKAISVTVVGAVDTVRMDPRLMSLALSNLLANACRYANENVRCTFCDKNGKYLLEIEDDGKGIPDSKRETIFKAFSRIDDSRNRDTGGFGLGLAIVARIAALHGGAIVADTSKDFGGAKFILSWSPIKT